MSGNLARRRMTKFMPADFKLIETRQPPLKDQYDEWLARIICYAFSGPASPFVSPGQSRDERDACACRRRRKGWCRSRRWVKSALDQVIQVCMNEPGLEFVWVGDDAVDPLQQAQTLNILVTAGIKTRDEARAELGLGAPGGRAADGPMGKWTFDPDQPRDEHGRLTADGGSETDGTTKPNESTAPTTGEHNRVLWHCHCSDAVLGARGYWNARGPTGSRWRDHNLHISIERIRPLFSNSR